jgi:hypothetical protein
VRSRWPFQIRQRRQSVIFEVWDTETRNLLEDFESEVAALEMVRDYLASYGNEFAMTLALVSQVDRGYSKSLAQGITLLKRVDSLAA